jgi:hypothetical protein
VLYDALNATTYTPGVSQRVNGVDTFFHTDWLGSTRYLTDSTGNNFPSALRYDAFGNRSATGTRCGPTPRQAKQVFPGAEAVCRVSGRMPGECRASAAIAEAESRSRSSAALPP